MSMIDRKLQPKGTTIVVVDDDPGICESLKDVLALENWDCVSAGTGKKGLDLIRSVRPQLVVSDVQLPDMSGYQLCQSLKRDSATRGIPVMMITGRFTEPDDRVQGFESGADEFLVKPFNPVLFVARIKSILRGLAPQPA